MIKENQYIRLHEVLSRALRHPLLQDMSLEAAAQYAVDFIHAVGTPDMFEDREAEIEIHNYRGKLPCDIISINQVMDLNTHTCMRAMTDTFFPEDKYILEPGADIQLLKQRFSEQKLIGLADEKFIAATYITAKVYKGGVIPTALYYENQKILTFITKL